VALRMRRRGAASWAWTCSISTGCVVPGPPDERTRRGRRETGAP
jgi:hypothetical protein